jgi:hypothetical protein
MRYVLAHPHRHRLVGWRLGVASVLVLVAAGVGAYLLTRGDGSGQAPQAGASTAALGSSGARLAALAVTGCHPAAGAILTIRSNHTYRGGCYAGVKATGASGWTVDGLSVSCVNTTGSCVRLVNVHHFRWLHSKVDGNGRGAGHNKGMLSIAQRPTSGPGTIEWSSFVRSAWDCIELDGHQIAIAHVTCYLYGLVHGGHSDGIDLHAAHDVHVTDSYLDGGAVHRPSGSDLGPNSGLIIDPVARTTSITGLHVDHIVIRHVGTCLEAHTKPWLDIADTGIIDHLTCWESHAARGGVHSSTDRGIHLQLSSSCLESFRASVAPGWFDEHGGKSFSSVRVTSHGTCVEDRLGAGTIRAPGGPFS